MGGGDGSGVRLCGWALGGCGVCEGEMSEEGSEPVKNLGTLLFIFFL